jgi:hypothetical protein
MKVLAAECLTCCVVDSTDRPSVPVLVHRGITAQEIMQKVANNVIGEFGISFVGSHDDSKCGGRPDSR